MKPYLTGFYKDCVLPEVVDSATHTLNANQRQRMDNKSSSEGHNYDTHKSKDDIGRIEKPNRFVDNTSLNSDHEEQTISIPSAGRSQNVEGSSSGQGEIHTFDRERVCDRDRKPKRLAGRWCPVES
ncbi:hypothetical protein PR048_009073 [Dryococelus australis]|uniref:Uncharacterized protein n=1 Tax=Dryococelus australis TaxID=614101 RepID=A0ABQ9HYW1_9NEOP|nr:hypothetical protein PR048_009073 [Dryococelus australis]